MFKRKVENSVLPINYKCGVINLYKNPLSTDNIGMCGNHIIFNSNVTSETLNIVLNTIKLIVEVNNIHKFPQCVYLHICSYGGSLEALKSFIIDKNRLFPQVELISIIEKNCTNVGFLLAAVCDYRIIKKNTICFMSHLDPRPDTIYWGAYKQFPLGVPGEFGVLYLLAYIFDRCKCKVTDEKLVKYLSYNNTWKCKKMLQIGFVDEIY
ncbi:hypothetical protein PGAG_00364 [Phaeocystis globosa virus 12T]|uniref:Uncharacterized protein n=1 Tax=Phaeocystis globosa virus PgV-16T TaxID=3071227 RepID=A0AC59EXM2_9VIRU|nr:hypothetical protein PGCG_00409 [Phaeocystis globosa virus]AET73253.1 hypothetical protein PGAG_00364 [Phaeocystis globosa virus 12T]AET73680.1 hypothetical protein PGBG_00369 [Phaeocystis globosa virus 14T]AGM15713.1 hypothetical protein PGCG_00409 [Phaeocystis globosa virus PgV-16T]UYE94443.1 Clp family protease [Phaeocystis globosa virus]